MATEQAISLTHTWKGIAANPGSYCDRAGIYLYWLPLGAGGVGFVRLDGRIYEALKSRLQGRRPLDIYHTALEIRLPEGRFMVENAWPSPDSDPTSRGVALEGPVFSRLLARFRPFRYEVRCWRDGVIADANEAVEVQFLSGDADRARHLVDLVPTVPPLVWGRDELEAGDMWNSNSVISYLLARIGVHAESVCPPEGGRAPGWDAGILAAAHSRLTRCPDGGRTRDATPTACSDPAGRRLDLPSSPERCQGWLGAGSFHR